MGKGTDDRPYMGMGALQGGDVAPTTTIVGGQPSAAPRAPRQRVPVGLERVLCAAAADPELARALVADRDAALAGRGFALTGSERAVLANLPPGQLAAMIARIDVSAENLARRGFLRNVAGTVVALAAGTALGACSAPTGEPAGPGGAPFLGPAQKTPDASVEIAPPQPPYEDPGPPAGARPDLPAPSPPDPSIGIGGIQPAPPPPPAVDVEPPPPPATRGIRPD